MDQASEAVLVSWSLRPAVIVPLVVVGAVYLRGWFAQRRRGSPQMTVPRAAAFLAGLGVVFVALCSPLDALAQFLLLVHMIQHLLLMFLAPILLWAGAPALPLLRGLPAGFRKQCVAPLVGSPPLRWLFGQLARPVTGWLLFVIVTWLWHVPALYDLSLARPAWHDVEHASFFWTGMIFWWPVMRPYPARLDQRSWWIMLPYLFLAGVQGTVLSALLTFSSRVLYTHYLAVPRVFGISALTDQAIAGALMWVPGSIAYLVPLVAIGNQVLYGHPQRAKPRPRRRMSSGAVRRRTSTAARRLDLLNVPVLGRLLRWRHGRLVFQVPLLLLAGLIIADGLFGPQVAPLNLAGVLPWIHWRGLLVVVLLLVGNVACGACPFDLGGNLARRWLPARWQWPSRLRNKWLAVGLLVAFFWAYERFALWDSPWWTAWIVVAYFLGAFVIDGFFRGAPFCKYVCPIGQFNFFGSLLSPLEVRVREADVCRRCETDDCIRGNDRAPGCRLYLFQPEKVGNMDCTLCLDCIHACPHDNVGILHGSWADVPAATGLVGDRMCSGIGRFSTRTDIAAMVVVLAFAALVNAAGMVQPVVEGEARLAAAWGLASVEPIVTAGAVLGLVIVPAVTVWGASVLTRWIGGLRDGTLTVATRTSYALVPLAFGMWTAHYLFHFVTGVNGAWPPLARVAHAVGLVGGGSAGAVCLCGEDVAGWLLRGQLLLLDFGLLASLYYGYRTFTPEPARAGRRMLAFAPWACLLVLLFAAGVWLVFQPMQMRGTMMMGGMGS